MAPRQSNGDARDFQFGVDAALGSRQYAAVGTLLLPAGIMAISGLLYLLSADTASSLDRQASDEQAPVDDPSLPPALRRAAKDERGKSRAALALFFVAGAVLAVRVVQYVT